MAADAPTPKTTPPAEKSGIHVELEMDKQIQGRCLKTFANRVVVVPPPPTPIPKWIECCGIFGCVAGILAQN